MEKEATKAFEPPKLPKMQIYQNGSDAFRAIWHEFDNATRSIFMETYILKPDVVGTKTIGKLAQAAKRGVK